jgi:hypothetical protein
MGTFLTINYFLFHNLALIGNHHHNITVPCLFKVALCPVDTPCLRYNVTVTHLQHDNKYYLPYNTNWVIYTLLSNTTFMALQMFKIGTIALSTRGFSF